MLFWNEPYAGASGVKLRVSGLNGHTGTLEMILPMKRLLLQRVLLRRRVFQHFWMNCITAQKWRKIESTPRIHTKKKPFVMKL